MYQQQPPPGSHPPYPPPPPPPNQQGPDQGRLASLVKAPGLFNVRNACIVAAIVVAVAALALVLNPDGRTNPVSATSSTNGDKLHNAMYRVESQTADQQETLQEFQDDLAGAAREANAGRVAAPEPDGNVPNRRARPEPTRTAATGSDDDGSQELQQDEQESDDPDEDERQTETADEIEPDEEPTLRDLMSNILGDRRSSNQLAAERLFNRWEPRYESALVGHESLVKRVDATRKYWSMYEQEQQSLIALMDPGSAASRESTDDLDNDRDLWLKWDEQASELLDKSDEAMRQLAQMDARIKFQRNRADFHAIITDADGQAISSSVSALIESLSEFNADTETLRNSINHG